MTTRRLRAALLTTLLVTAAIAISVAGSATPAAAAYGDITEFSLPSQFGFVGDMTEGPDGRVWFTTDHEVAAISPNGIVATYPPDFGITASSYITTGPDGNLWVTGHGPGVDAIYRFTPAGAVTTFDTPGFPSRIIAGPDGNLWFVLANGLTGKIARMTTSGDVTVLPMSGIENIADFTFGPDGNLWLTLPDDDRIVRLTPTGFPTTFEGPNVDRPLRITAGPDGNLWFTSFSNDGIGRITPDGAVTVFGDVAGHIDEPNGITTGPDGNLWFTSYGNDRIGRITPGGIVRTFGDPGGGVDLPVRIIPGPDGNLWFTNVLSVGRIDPTNFAPIPVNDTYATPHDTQLEVGPAQGVLANDVDQEDDPLTATLGSPPEHGTVTLASGGGFTYTPEPGFAGIDFFTYTASDGSNQSAPAVVNIVVNNIAPEGVDDSYTTADDTQLTVGAPGVLANDTDDDGDDLSAFVVSEPAHGAVGLNANGSFAYVPHAGFAGTDTFTYVPSDGIDDGTPATVTIAVLDLQPDLQIRAAGSNTYLGDDVHNPTGDGQSVTRTRLRLLGGDYFVRIQNDSTVAPDRFLVAGSPVTPGFDARYYDGDVDVTNQVLSGQFRTPEIAPGEHHTLRVRVTPGLLAPLFGQDVATVTATSLGNGTRTDTVKATTNTI